jgi:hypothetical protein
MVEPILVILFQDRLLRAWLILGIMYTGMCHHEINTLTLKSLPTNKHSE